MVSFPREANRVPVIGGVSSADFSTPVTIAVDPSTHAVLISGSISATNPSVGTNTATAPTSSTEIGWIDGSGNLQGVSAANPLPVSASFSPSGTQDVNLTKVGGSAIALGQALAAASLPVVLTAAQISTLTPLSTVAATQSGTWSTRTQDGSGNAITSSGAALDVNLKTSSITLSNNLAQINAHTVLEAGVNGTLVVGGNQATNNNVSTNVDPVLIAGSDYGGTPKIQNLKVDSTGKQYIATVDTVTSVTAIANALPAGSNVIGHVVTDSGSVVAATLSAETTKVIGTVRNLGNAGATLDSTVGAGTAPANQVVVGALYNSTEISPSTGQAFALQADSKGRLREVIMDAAGNTRGANVNASNQLVTAPTAQSTDFYPMYNRRDLGGGQLATDPSGALVTRGAITTDEGTGRASFTGNSLSISPGTATFTNGSSAVTGSGFTATDLHFLDFVKLGADSETAWSEISFVNSDTSLTLFSPYTGTGGTGTYNLSQLATSTGTGATISVANGALTIALGTNTSAATAVFRNGSDNPVVYMSSFSISQRVANQDIYAGLETAIASPIKQFARFHFTGTNNTVVVTETGYNPTTDPSASETETNSVTLPGGATTASANMYRIEQEYEAVTFSINGVIVAVHTLRIPHDATENGNSIVADIRAINSGAVTNTNIVASFVLLKNFNRIDVQPTLPSQIGGTASVVLPTAGTSGSVMPQMMDKFGRNVSLQGTIRDLRSSQTTTISSSTSETTVITAASGIFNDVVALVFANTSGTGTRVDIRDATAGTVIGSLWVPANDTRGFAIAGESLPQTTANNNWTVTCGTSVADLRVLAVFDKNK